MACLEWNRITVRRLERPEDFTIGKYVKFRSGSLKISHFSIDTESATGDSRLKAG